MQSKGIGKPLTRGPPSLQPSKTDTGLSATKSKESTQCPRLPFLTRTINDLTNTDFFPVTQELRLKMMQQTVSFVGNYDSFSSIPHCDMGSTLDALLDTASMGEEVLNRHDININKPPWYLPSLNVHQLVTCCCHPNSSPLFRCRDDEHVSMFCHCSTDSIPSVPKAGVKPSQARRLSLAKGEGSPPRESVCGGVSSIKRRRRYDRLLNNHTPLETRRSYRELTNVQRMAVERWCFIISDVSCKERNELNPVELHDKAMKVVHIEESTVPLVEMTLNHERMQKWQYNKEAQEEEKERLQELKNARKHATEKHSWQTLLTSWTKDEKDIRAISTGMSQCSQTVRTRDATSDPLHLHMAEGGPLMNKGTRAQSCISEATSYVASPHGGLEPIPHTSRRSGTEATQGRPSAAEGCSPATELQKLLVAIRDGTLLPKAPRCCKGVDGGGRSVQAMYERSNRSSLFPPPVTTYMSSRWLECVICAEDLQGVKLITSKLHEHVSSKFAQSSGDVISLSLNGVAYGVHGETKHMQVLRDQSELQSSLVVAANENRHLREREECALLLIPLRLSVISPASKPRVFVVDAVSVAGAMIQTEKDDMWTAGTASTFVKEIAVDGSYGNLDVLRRRTLSSLGLSECFTATPVIGGAQILETLVSYSVDINHIVKQSTWRAATAKQLANEEYNHLQRRLLAKVFVSLTMSNAVASCKNRNAASHHTPRGSGCHQANINTLDPSCSSQGVRVALHSMTLPKMPTLPGLQDETNLELSLQDFIIPLTCATKATSRVEIWAAPPERDQYVVDMKNLFCTATAALEETNNVILPELRRISTDYRRVCSRHMRTGEDGVGGTTLPSSLGFTFADSERATAQISDALELLKLEEEYGKLLTTLLRNECTIIYYNLHHLPHDRFMQQRKQLWGFIHLRTLRLAYAFCIVVEELGLSPIPKKYRPFLRPVLQVLSYHGGQEELRSRMKETILELEMRASELGAMLTRKEAASNYLAELDAAAAVVAEGEYTASRFISSLASPNDVLYPLLLPVELPKVLFTDVPSVAG